jgi:hypothetical protein
VYKRIILKSDWSYRKYFVRSKGKQGKDFCGSSASKKFSGYFIKNFVKLVIPSGVSGVSIKVNGQARRRIPDSDAS